MLIPCSAGTAIIASITTLITCIHLGDIYDEKSQKETLFPRVCSPIAGNSSPLEGTATCTNNPVDIFRTSTKC